MDRRTLPTFPQLLQLRHLIFSLESQVHLHSLPGIINLHEYVTDQAQASYFVRKDPHHPRPAVNLTANSLQAVSGADQTVVGSREGQDGQPLNDVSFQPGGQPSTLRDYH